MFHKLASTAFLFLFHCTRVTLLLIFRPLLHVLGDWKRNSTSKINERVSSIVKKNSSSAWFCFSLLRAVKTKNEGVFVCDKEYFHCGCEWELLSQTIFFFSREVISWHDKFLQIWLIIFFHWLCHWPAIFDKYLSKHKLPLFTDHYLQLPLFLYTYVLRTSNFETFALQKRRTS